MDELLQQAEQALQAKDGRTALERADQVLARDENCAQAWLIAMKSFQLIYPIDAYDPQNEIACGKNAIRSASREEKARVRKQVYDFYLTKILEVLKRDAQVLSDGKQLLTYYQAMSFQNAQAAPRLTLEHDRPVVQAVLHSLDYCVALFDAIPPSFLKKSAALRDRAAEVAVQWRYTYSYLEMRYEMCGSRLTRPMVENGLRQYARFLSVQKDRRALLEPPVPFNIYQLDQLAYLAD